MKPCYYVKSTKTSRTNQIWSFIIVFPLNHWLESWISQPSTVVAFQLLSHIQLFATHGLQHAKLAYLSLSCRVCSNSCPLSWWCYDTFSSSAALFSFCLQSFPALGSFPMSWLFTSGDQGIEASPRTWNLVQILIFFSTTSYAIKLCNSDFHVEDLCHMILHVTCPYVPLIP